MSGSVRSELNQEATRCGYDFAAQGEPDVLRPVSFHLRRCLSHCRWAVRRKEAGVAAAAMIALAAIFHYAPSAGGIALGEMMRAFGRVDNVHLVKFDPIDEQIVYELLISRRLNIMSLARRGRSHLVYDLAGRRKGDLDAGTIEPLDDNEYAFARRLMNAALGFTMAGVPSGAEWEHVKSDGTHEVYELTWTREAYPGHPVEVKYEITIDASTDRPEGLRLFHKDALARGWECQSLIGLEYPTDDEMESMLMAGSLAGIEGRH